MDLINIISLILAIILFTIADIILIIAYKDLNIVDEYYKIPYYLLVGIFVMCMSFFLYDATPIFGLFLLAPQFIINIVTIKHFGTSNHYKISLILTILSIICSLFAIFYKN